MFRAQRYNLSMKIVVLILSFLPVLASAQDDDLYLRCQYDEPWSQISLDGATERSLEGEIWHISETLRMWRGFNLYTSDSFPAQSYTEFDLARDLNLLDTQPATQDFRINMGIEKIDLYVGGDVFIEINRMSGRFSYSGASEPSGAEAEEIDSLGGGVETVDEDDSLISGDCQSISKEEVRTLLNDQSNRYESVIEVIEETRKF